MRTALLISGEMRNYKDPEIVNSFQKIINDLNCDVFISTWSVYGYSYNHGSGTPYTYSKNTVILDDIQKTYKNIKSIEIEDESTWLSTCDPVYKDIYRKGFIWEGQNIRGTVVPQLYKIFRANELKKKYEEENNFIYDLVIRSRPDNLHYGLLNKDYLQDLHKIFAINHFPHYYPNRIFDIFFYSNSKNMDILSNAYHELLENIDNTIDNGLNKYDACRILYVQAIKNNIPVFDLPYIPCFKKM